MSDIKTEIGAEIVGRSIVDMLKLILGMILGAFKGFAPEMAKSATEKMAKNMEQYRVETLWLFRKLAATNSDASARLFRRHEDRLHLNARNYGAGEPYRPGDENTFVTVFSKIYRAFDKPEQHQERMELVEWLGSIPDSEDASFDAKLEFAIDDRVFQWIRRIGGSRGMRLFLWAGGITAITTMAATTIYLGILSVVALVGFAIPLGFVIYGISTGTQMITLLGGLLWGFFSLLVLAAASPAAWVVNAIWDNEGITGKVQRVGEKYVNFVAWWLMIGHFIALTSAIVPMHRNPLAAMFVWVAIFCLCAAKRIWRFGTETLRNIVVRTCTVTIIVGILSCFAPATAEAMGKKIIPNPEEDKGVARTVECWQPWTDKVPDGCPTPTPAPQTQGQAQPATPASTSITTLENPPDFPVCENAGETIELNFGPDGGGEAPLRTDCWTRKFKVMPTVDVSFRVDNSSGKGYEYLFLSGERVPVTEDGTLIGTKYGRLMFRLRGLHGEGHARVAIRPL
jgi:hypothetical protein